MSRINMVEMFFKCVKVKRFFKVAFSFVRVERFVRVLLFEVFFDFGR